MFTRYLLSEPTLLAIAMSLSLSTMSKLLLLAAALFNPSNANPPAIEASPITAITLRRFSPFRREEIAMPRAAEMELEA